MTPTMTLFLIALIASYIIADLLEFDLLHALVSQLLMLPFRPFEFFFNLTAPFIKTAVEEDRLTILVQAWLFSLDCVIAGSESLLAVCYKLGI
jgi:hypothetical protein